MAFHALYIGSIASIKLLVEEDDRIRCRVLALFPVRVFVFVAFLALSHHLDCAKFIQMGRLRAEFLRRSEKGVYSVVNTMERRFLSAFVTNATVNLLVLRNCPMFAVAQTVTLEACSVWRGKTPICDKARRDHETNYEGQQYKTQ